MAEGITPDRAPQRLRGHARPGRRAVRDPDRLGLASARRVDGQPPHPDRRDDRQPRLHRRQAPGRDRGDAAARAQDRLRRRLRVQRPPAIWAALDQVHAKHPDMVLLHGGSPKGAERIAACWADHRKVPQIAFKPDLARTRTPRRSSATTSMLEALPIGVVRVPRLRHLRTTSPTRRGGSASRCSTIASRRGPRPRHCAPAISLDHL